MGINKSNLKKLLMPVVKECIKETLSDQNLLREVVLSSGVLSTIVKEVAEGLSYSQQPINYSAHLNASTNRVPQAVQEARQRREDFRQQASVLPMPPQKKKKKPNSEFEKAQSQVDSSYAQSSSRHGALAGSDPDDSGVSLAGFGFANIITETKRPDPSDAGVDIAELMSVNRR